MANLQLLLSIGIPSVLIVLGWLTQNQRLTDLRTDLNSLRIEACSDMKDCAMKCAVRSALYAEK